MEPAEIVGAVVKFVFTTFVVEAVVLVAGDVDVDGVWLDGVEVEVEAVLLAF